MPDRRPITLITGASAGIGWALADVFARNGHELVLVARREERLAALAEEIAAKGHPKPLVLSLDVASKDAVERLAERLAMLGVEPQIIVNNAGFGLVGETARLDREEQLAMVDLNVRALTALSLAFVDSLERHCGGILNVASVAAYLPGPRMAVYYATKAYVLSFSEALGCELKARGIRVTALCPGPVPTEFQGRAGFTKSTRTEALQVSAEAVAEAGYRGLQQGRSVVVPGALNWWITALLRFIPHGLLLGMIERRNARAAS